MLNPPSKRAALAAAGAALLVLSAAQAQERDPGSSSDDAQEIIVTADPFGERTVDDLIQPVTVMAGDELDRNRAGTLGEVLDGLPGVANSDFGAGVGRPVIRGLQGSRVQVLEDGLATADVSGEGADHAIAIDPAHATQIEVFRGPATLLYGSGAAGGVVNTHTRRFDPTLVDSPRIVGELAYGANGNDRQGTLFLEAPAGERFVLRGNAGLRRTDDFDIDGFQGIDQTQGNQDRLRNSDIETDSYSLTGLFRDHWGYLGLGLSTWETEYGIPENFDARPLELGGQADHLERSAAEYDRLDLHGEMIEPLPGFSAARLKMGYTEFEQKEVEFEFERTPEGGRLDEREVEAEFENDELDTRLELVHDPVRDWSGVMGLQYRRRDFVADDPRSDERGFYVRPNETDTASLFLLEERSTDFGRLELGARIERERSRPGPVRGSQVEGVTLSNGDFLPLPEQLGSQSFAPFSLSAGTIVDIGEEHHLRAGLTRAERAPSPEQLYAFGRHAAAGTFEIGDPDLGKEAYLNLELGIDRHAPNFHYDLTLFYNRVDDFVFLQSEDDGTGQPFLVNDIGNRAGEGAAADCEPGEGDLCNLRNQLVFNRQDDAEFYGIELGSAADLLDGPVPLSVRLSADHVRGKLRDGGNLPRITPTRLGLGFDTGYRELDLRIDYRRVFKQTSTGVAEDSTSGFNLLSLDLLWRPMALGGAEVFLKGRNLLNEDGRRHQSFFKHEAPILGRAFTAGLRFDFGG